MYFCWHMAYHCGNSMVNEFVIRKINLHDRKIFRSIKVNILYKKVIDQKCYIIHDCNWIA